MTESVLRSATHTNCCLIWTAYRTRCRWRSAPFTRVSGNNCRRQLQTLQAQPRLLEPPQLPLPFAEHHLVVQAWMIMCQDLPGHPLQRPAALDQPASSVSRRRDSYPVAARASTHHQPGHRSANATPQPRGQWRDRLPRLAETGPIAVPHGKKGRPEPPLRSCIARPAQRSTIATTPMPPAVQIDTSARPPPRSASCLAAVAITRAPVAANG